MKSFGRLLVLASLVFGVFSYVHYDEYTTLLSKRRSIWSDQRRAPSYSPEHERLEREEGFIERQMDDVHDTVRAVSIPYYLLYLGFFIGLLKGSGKRGIPIAAMLICVVMIGWSFILSRAAAFDEVWPAWVASAVVLVILQLIGLKPLTKPKSAPE